jgi:3-oxoacyl-[acyl-carrier protein] reductase
MNLNLTGKTALVTAASGGIGSGVAEALAEAGVRVAISGRTRASLEMVAETLASRAGGRPAIVVGDVGAKGGPAQIAADAAAAVGGRIDILVNNAGASRPITDEVDDADAYWEESLTLNFMAARRLTEFVIPAMKAERWGRIISISGALVAPKLNAAAPAKAALASWSRTLAFELGKYGITVNTIAPGRINTAQILTKLHPTEQSRADYIKQNIPAGYFGEPYDIGHLVAFLACPLARYINGAAIPVDGGAVRRAL